MMANQSPQLHQVYFLCLAVSGRFCRCVWPTPIHLAGSLRFSGIWQARVYINRLNRVWSPRGLMLRTSLSRHTTYRGHWTRCEVSVSVGLFSGQIPYKNSPPAGLGPGEAGQWGSRYSGLSSHMALSVSWWSHGGVVWGVWTEVLREGAKGRIKGGQRDFRVFTSIQSEMLLGRVPHLPLVGWPTGTGFSLWGLLLLINVIDKGMQFAWVS